MRILCSMLTMAIGIAITIAVPVLANGTPTILFDTFGPGDTYDTSIGWGIGTESDVDSACQFTIAAETPNYLEKIELAVGLVTGTNQLEVWLMNDVAGEPGAIIEAFTFDGEMGSFGSANPPLAANSVLLPILYPSTPYWLVTSVPTTDSLAAWNISLPTINGKFGQRFGLEPWWISSSQELGAFRITGTAVPTIDDVLLFIAMSVDDGTLTGYGPGNSAEGRLNALINMVEEAEELIELGMFAEAYEQLLDAYNRTDGESPPSDFVAGDAAPLLAALIMEILESL